MPGNKSTSTKSKTKSSRSGLTFPVGRVHRILRKGRYASRIGCGAAVYISAVLEYLSAEILELSAKAAQDNNRARILPRHIMLAIGNDEELDRMLSGVTISHGGVMPRIEPELLPKKTAIKSHSIDTSMMASQEY
ncbi:histone H2A, sperm-like isoform X2 [Danaus plexippus]|uniref:histone H2A, sperm-like isoform X2 n=1 Tax=Danaus plexippus TaxID=13037 RepID=UPI002AB2175F|nr:histone H2A, sperm-like isoform X2 [Danaus plexippus]